MSKKYKIFIVDDHDMFRDGVKLMLNSGNKYEIIAEARNGKEFLDKIESYAPDVILMDISMPVMNGIDATKKALEANPSLNILALSMFGDEEYYFKMIQSGVKGFVLKSSGISELEKAITIIANGENYFSSELLRQIIFNIRRNKENPEQQSSNDTLLTKREIEVLKEIANGLSNEDIAEKLNISIATVKSHRASLLSKTGCNNTASLVMYAIKNKIITIA